MVVCLIDILNDDSIDEVVLAVAEVFLHLAKDGGVL